MSQSHSCQRHTQHWLYPNYRVTDTHCTLSTFHNTSTTVNSHFLTTLCSQFNFLLNHWPLLFNHVWVLLELWAPSINSLHVINCCIIIFTKQILMWSSLTASGLLVTGFLCIRCWHLLLLIFCVITLICLLDLSAAFDTIDHDILLTRLSSWFGIHGSVLNWFKSYLSSRTFCVKCNDCFSSLHTSLYGVPQGSVLGPLLFIMYTTPL